MLSIKPEYVKKILNGTKKYEYRRRLAKMKSTIILIYSTYPIMKVVGQVKILGTMIDSPAVLWEKTKKNSGISKKNYQKYFCGCDIAYAYKLGEVEIFDYPKSLSEYNVKSAPQSFIYVNI